jgi:hypothetical protein
MAATLEDDALRTVLVHGLAAAGLVAFSVKSAFSS